MINRVSRLVILRLLRGTRHGELTLVEPDGTVHRFGAVDAGDPLRARIELHDPQVWRAFAGGSLGIGRSYMDGAWVSPDLVAATRLGARNMPVFDRIRSRLRFLIAPVQAITGLARRNTIARSRDQIAAHYDLGNELYSRFLDPSMMYSAAVFERPGMTLEEAQTAKLDRICRKLDLQPSDHLLEIGTGWGAMAIHAARHYGCRVTTTTISAEQHALALERVGEAGLQDRIEVLRRDYRALTGTYSKLVSIEMIEAVGWQDFPTFFSVCSDRLAPDGLMLLQAITIDERAYEIEKATRTFINQLIFPGGCLPSQEVIARCVAQNTTLRAIGLEDITDHYVTTLQHWRTAFNAAADELDGLGYDERFRRLWNLYLSYSEGGFTERRICDIQLLLAGPRFTAEQLSPLPVPPRIGRAVVVTADDEAAA